jgi:hypothetical protein
MNDLTLPYIFQTIYKQQAEVLSNRSYWVLKNVLHHEIETLQLSHKKSA